MKDRVNIIDRAYVEANEKWCIYNNAGIRDVDIGRHLGLVRSNINLYHNKIKKGTNMKTNRLREICEYFGITIGKSNIVDRAYAEVNEKWKLYNDEGVLDSDIARELNMTRSNISLYHNAIKSNKNMNTDTLKAICEYFKI